MNEAGTPSAESGSELERLRREAIALRSAIGLLHRIGNLVGGALELEPTCYAVLTAVTAGVGLGLNRAMLFLADPKERSVLRGAAAIGPADRREADRVWRSIEADAPDLETLYESGLRHHQHPGELDRRVRETTVDGAGSTPVALAFRCGTTVIGEGEDDRGGLFHAATAIAAPLRDAQGVSGVLYAERAAAVLVGARLRAVVSDQPFALGAERQLHITCSIGVASLPEDAADATALVEAADKAMFRAKAAGKDRVGAPASAPYPIGTPLAPSGAHGGRP